MLKNLKTNPFHVVLSIDQPVLKKNYVKYLSMSAPMKVLFAKVPMMYLIMNIISMIGITLIIDGIMAIGDRVSGLHGMGAQMGLVDMGGKLLQKKLP